jgi:hypothetical protein
LRVDDGDTELRIRIIPGFAGDPPGDWSDQVAALYDALATNGSPVRLVPGPAGATDVQGIKGLTEIAEIVLASAAAIRAANQVFSTWLSRDRRREIRVEIPTSAGTKAVTATIGPSDNRTFGEVARLALPALEGGEDG